MVHALYVFLCAGLLVAFTAISALPARAHPHVFVDGGVDFVFTKDTLTGLQVTWLYDPFETLYIMSSERISLNDTGKFTGEFNETDRAKLVKLQSEWPSDFTGSAHLAINGKPVALDEPSGFDAKLIDGRLKITFSRQLKTPIQLTGLQTELAFYESTYFYAFAITNTPKLIGAEDACTAKIIRGDPDEQNEAFQATLLKLSREETPEMAQVGELFADRISLQCA